MRKGRTVIYLAASFLCGVFISAYIPYAPVAYLAAALLGAVLCSRKATLVGLMISFSLIGIAALQISVYGYQPVSSAIDEWASQMRGRFASFLERLVQGEDELSVLKALTIGDKSNISRDIKNNFRASGAAHILALSGLHVGIIYKMLSYGLFFIGGSRRMQFIRKLIILLILWTFAIITGLSPSIFRAVLMISLYETGSLVGASKDGIVTLAVSAMIITLTNPQAAFEISFQLSFLACLGIFVIYPRMKRMLNTKSFILNYIWSGASLAVSCQIVTAPLSYYYFGTFPRYFLLTNLLTVPLSAAILYSAAGSIITVNIPTIGPAIASLLTFIINMLNTIVELISKLQ